MPELPEVEITARLIGAATAGAGIESALAPGINALQDLRPAAGALDGGRIAGVRRRGKLFLIDVRRRADVVVIHLMSAGRLQLFDTRASLRDRTSRLLVRLDDGRELRLREFGTKQRAWVKLLRSARGRGRGDDRRARTRGVARAATAVRRAARCTRARCTRCCATST